jgi:2-(1,2-epoxy-1,2-dihydrophenyl)acetyl-CoA isomerase
MKVKLQDGVAELWLDRPERHNSLDLELAEELLSAIEQVAACDDLRVVLLAAEGRSFCVGGDIAGFLEAEDPQASVSHSADALNRALSALTDLGVPVVARVQGAVAGAGLGLVLAADLAIAGPDASFTAGYTAIGFTPDAGVSWWLPRCVGHRRAAELLLMNRRVPAEEAAAIGLVTEAVEDGEALDRRVAELTEGLARAATGACATALAQLRDGAHASLATQLNREARDIGAAAGSADGREGVTAFAERRTPRFGARRLPRGAR